MTVFSLMMIHQLLQIGLKVYNFFSIMKFMISEVKWKRCMNITKLMIHLLNVIKGWSWWDQINLQEECNFKTKLINSLLDNLFNHESHRTKLHNDNATLTHSEADSQFPKWQACKRICQSQSNPKLTLSNRHESLRDCDISKWNDNVIIHRLPLEEDASEKNVKTSDTCKQNY